MKYSGFVLAAGVFAISRSARTTIDHGIRGGACIIPKLDVAVIQDISYSFGPKVERYVSHELEGLYRGLYDLTNELRLGFSVFQDKPYLTWGWGKTSPGWKASMIPDVCYAKVDDLKPVEGHSFDAHLDGVIDFYRTVGVGGGNDFAENQLGAMTNGIRDFFPGPPEEDRKRVMVVVTDSLYHHHKDGKFPSDGSWLKYPSTLSELLSVTTDDTCHKYYYPEIEHVGKFLKEMQIEPVIFLYDRVDASYRKSLKAWKKVAAAAGVSKNNIFTPGTRVADHMEGSIGYGIVRTLEDFVECSPKVERNYETIVYLKYKAAFPAELKYFGSSNDATWDNKMPHKMLPNSPVDKYETHFYRTINPNTTYGSMGYGDWTKKLGSFVVKFGVGPDGNRADLSCSGIYDCRLVSHTYEKYVQIITVEVESSYVPEISFERTEDNQQEITGGAVIESTEPDYVALTEEVITTEEVSEYQTTDEPCDGVTYPPVDIIILQDATNSFMEHREEYIDSELEELITYLSDLGPDVRVALGSVKDKPYHPYGYSSAEKPQVVDDYCYTPHSPLTSINKADIPTFVQKVRDVYKNEIVFGGGLDEPENQFGGMIGAIKHFFGGPRDFSSDRMRIIINVTDARFHHAFDGVAPTRGGLLPFPTDVEEAMQLTHDEVCIKYGYPSRATMQDVLEYYDVHMGVMLYSSDTGSAVKMWSEFNETLGQPSGMVNYQPSSETFTLKQSIEKILSNVDVCK